MSTSSSGTPQPASRHGVAAGLHWVRGELDLNLQLASQLVEQHSEARGEVAPLTRALGHLHEVRGAAVLIQAYGVALLAEEMKQTVQDLAKGTVHEPDPAYSAIVGACVQAADYLDLLQQGQTDSVLVLQPIVNELRLARGKSLLTEDDLFVAQFRVLGLHLERTAPPREGVDAKTEAVRLSPVFSSALLAWFKDQDTVQALSRIGRVAEVLAEACRERTLHQLWRTAAACVEALLSKGLDETLELKRQFGRAGQLLKILAESGEAAAVRQMSDVSLRLLFYAGRSHGSGPRVAALRSGLELDRWLPAPDAVQASRACLRGTNTGLLVRVTEELRADLAEVRDSIDVALRSGGSTQEFDATAQRLKRVADTLLVLGLSAESQALAQPVETLREAGHTDAAAWMEFATAVLQVDLSLDSALYRQLQPASAAGGSPLMTGSADLREGTAALLRESLVNLARVKGYIEAFIKSEDVFGLPEAARLLDEIAAGFRVLSLDRAEELTLDVQQFLQSPDFAAVRSSNTTAGRFADAIAAVEYYLEFRRDGSPGSEAVLDQLAILVARLRAPLEAPAPDALGFAQDLGLPAPVVPETVVAAPEHEAAPPSAPAAPFELAIADYVPPAAAEPAPALPAEEPEFHLIGEPIPEAPAEAPEAQEIPAEPVVLAEAASEAPAAPVAEAAPPPRAASLELEIDPEIRQVFIDEADEVLGELQKALPRWLRQPEERDTLVSIRRGFHTLKGSGRMVGAQDIGEFSWAIESLLNRCLDRTLDTTPALRDVVRDAVELVPEMIAAFRDDRAQPVRALQIAERARLLAAGSELPEGDDLLAVFRNDAAQRLQLVLRWVSERDRALPEHEVPEPVVRAFHTLRGAALAIGVKAVGELAGALESHLETLHRAHQGLSGDGLALLEDASRALARWITQAGEPGAEAVDPRPWLERIEALRAGATPSAATATREADEDLELAEIFAFEALDLVQRFEADLQAWSQAPQAAGQARALKATIHTLKGAAGMAQCAPLAAVAQALNLHLGALAEGFVPSPAYFDAARRVVEGLYAQLDAYRDGSLSGDGAEWLPGVAALDALAAGAALAAPAEPPAEAAAPAMADDIATIDFDLQDAYARDEELREIFLQEGEELIDEIEQHAAAIAARPDDPFVLGAWLRALHTLKGSARAAGASDIGDLAHRIETATEAVQHDPAGHERFRAELRVGVEGLQELLAELRDRGAGAFARIRARLDAVATQAAQAELARLAETVVPAEPEPASAPTPVEAEPALDVAEPSSQAAPDAPDAELLAIFAPEGRELLEALDGALSAWREIPDSADFPRQMQRDLHTFKGGARLAGLPALGDAAHALETELVRLERDGGSVDAGALRDVAARLDTLHRRYDEACAGGVPVAPLSEPVAAMPEPVAATPVAFVASQETPVVEAPVAEAAEEPVAETLAEPALDTAPLPPPFVAADAPMDADAAQELPTWDPRLFWRPGGDDTAAAEARREAVRVPVERLDAMLSQAGEISIFRARLEENHASLVNALSEMAQTITRVREQLRLMEVETEAQIAARGFSRAEDAHRYDAQFDALEMDRYSRMQELSRALAESVSDMGSLHASLDTAGSEAEGLMQQQGRITNEVQQALMSTLMVPFSRQINRLSRVVRQTAEQNGKRARVEFSGAESELDRNVLERMTAPLEHLLRNSIVHGIEAPDVREAMGKDPEGLVLVSLKRDGSHLLIELRDDGRGLDFDAIRTQAVRRGLMRADASVSNDDLSRFIFAAGFSTARTLTQDAGRGIGMDVVAAEVKQLGGAVDLASEAGHGVHFRIRLPLMLAVSQALVVQVGEELFAIPLGAVEGIARAPREALPDMLRDGGPPLEYGGQQYHVRRLGELVGLPPPARIDARSVPAILMRLGDGLGGPERRVAVVADRLIGNREIVSKAAGPVLGSVAGVSGATILADGRVMLIVDVPALIREAVRRRLGVEASARRDLAAAEEEARPLILVVDDSITIRRVTERLLLRKGYRVITAKDGLDAMATLQSETPDAVLLDIEMPRADGFEVAAFIRNTPRLSGLPIVMITSRSGDKHREHARSLGVDRYLIKPYQEDQLLAELRTLLAAREAQSA